MIRFGLCSSQPSITPAYPEDMSRLDPSAKISAIIVSAYSDGYYGGGSAFGEYPTETSSILVAGANVTDRDVALTARPRAGHGGGAEVRLL
jgi:hypothetical protein